MAIVIIGNLLCFALGAATALFCTAAGRRHTPAPAPRHSEPALPRRMQNQYINFLNYEGDAKGQVEIG